MRASDRDQLIRQLIDETTTCRTDPAGTATSVLVVAAVLAAASPDLLGDAARIARSTADRQFVAIAAAHVSGHHERVDALARDHLLDHPARPVLTWIVAQSRSNATNQGANP